MNGSSFMAVTSAVAASIAENKTDEELNLLACFFTQLGDCLATIVVGNECFCNSKESKLTNDDSILLL